jgi:acyl CoA:acetate/3-ketoacid CoA transferase beta subunit
VFACDKARAELTLLELAPGVTVDEIQNKTAALFSPGVFA